jgi:hypothetical protein
VKRKRKKRNFSLFSVFGPVQLAPAFFRAQPVFPSLRFPLWAERREPSKPLAQLA